MKSNKFLYITLSTALIAGILLMTNSVGIVHALATITEVTPVPSIGNNQTPSYTFSSDAAGSIAYGGPCSSMMHISASIGNNTVTFDPLFDGTYSTCTISVDDGGGLGNILNIPSFIIDTEAPNISLVGPTTVNMTIGGAYSDSGATWNDNSGSGGFLIASGTVNTAIAGTYFLTFDVSDLAGNAATRRTRTVNVNTGGIPVITRNGNTPVIIQLGTPYVDAGATATDPEQGDMTADIITVNPVDVDTLGTYVITYNVTDAQGNAAVQVTRTVDVVGGSVPNITRLGLATVLHELGTTYIDAGATATDLQDGDRTSSIVTVNPVDSNNPGTYTVTYDVVDTAGNPAPQVTRTVIVADRTPAVITLSGSSVVSVTRGTSYIDVGASWTDAIDGSGILVASGTVNTGALGTYTLSYGYTDAAGNVSTGATRTVNVITGGVPTITLIGSGNISLPLGGTYTESGATANDTEDGVLTPAITITGSVNTSVPGTYLITYSVTDSNTNTTTLTRVVDVYDPIPPVVTLMGSGAITLNAGTTYIELGARWSDNVDGSGTINPTGSVNVNVVGNYTLTYNYIDAGGNSGVAVTRIVTIVPAPVVVPVVPNPTNNAGPGGGGGGSAPMGTYTNNVNAPVIPLNSAPVGIDASKDLIPHIVRILRSAYRTMNSAPQKHESTLLTVASPVTDYICPVVSKMHTEDDDLIANVSEGEYTPDVQSLLMYRSVDNTEINIDPSARFTLSQSSGIITDTSFGGNKAVTRAEFIKLLARSLSCHYTSTSETAGYSDVQEGAWYTEYINFAAENGWINAQPGDKFRPHELITRGEVAKILSKAIQLETSSPEVAIFSDLGATHPLAQYVYTLMDYGILETKDTNKFYPNSNISGNEVARIINNTFLNIE